MSEIDVFISYKREERNLADRVQNALNDAGFVVGTDADIEPSMDFVDAIQAMVDTAKATIVLWTKASTQSEWVKVEARRALKLHRMTPPKTIFKGVLLEDVDLPMDFETVNMLNFAETGLNEHAVQAIVADIKKDLAPTAKSADEARGLSAAFHEELQAFHTADQIDDAAAMQGFVHNYPNSILIELANKRIRGHQKIWPRLMRKTLTIGGLGVVFAAAGVSATIFLNDGAIMQPNSAELEQVSLLNSRLAEAQNSLDALQQRNDQLANLERSQGSTINALESLEQNLRDSLEAAEFRLTRLQDENAGLTERFENTAEQLEEANTLRSEDEAKFQARVTFLEEGLSLTQAARDRALATLSETQQTADDQRLQLDAAEQLLQQRAELIAQRDQQIADLGAELLALQENPQSLLTGLSSAERAMIADLNADVLYDLIFSYGTGTRYCSDDGSFNRDHLTLADAGLIVMTDEPCNPDESTGSFSAIASDGGRSLARKLRDAIQLGLGKS